MISKSNSDLMSEINVTPFVDVMLVLLIIFMVTAPMMIQGVEVSLPQASSKALPTDKEHLILSINKDSEIYINELKVSLDFLKEKLGKILEGRNNREIFLKADKTVPYGIVVNVMSEVKAAGVSKLGMLTEPIKG
jgi:biopolymer transport protein TolR